MGLISRVSSRTYRSAQKTSSRRPRSDEITDETRRAEDTSNLSDAKPVPAPSQRIKPSGNTSSETWSTLLLFEICLKLPFTPPKANNLLSQKSTTRVTIQSLPLFTCESSETEAGKTRKSELHHHDGAVDHKPARNKL